MYINADPDAGSADPGQTPGIGGPTGQRIETLPAVLTCSRRPAATLEAAGAQVVDVDFPVVSNYEGDRAGAPQFSHAGWSAESSCRRLGVAWPTTDRAKDQLLTPTCTVRDSQEATLVFGIIDKVITAEGDVGA